MFLRASVKGSSKSRLVTSTLAKWYTIYRILNSHSFKVAKKPFQTLGHIFAKPKDPVTKEQPTDLVYSLFLAMTVTTNTSHRPNLSLVHAWKSIKKRFSLVKKENSALSEHTFLTNHTVGRDNSKTNRRYQQRSCLEAWHINSAHAPLTRDDGGLLPDAYLHLVRKKGS